MDLCEDLCQVVVADLCEDLCQVVADLCQVVVADLCWDSLGWNVPDPSANAWLWGKGKGGGAGRWLAAALDWTGEILRNWVKRTKPFMINQCLT